MQPIPLVRAQYLSLVANRLREVGAPVERRLVQSRLPSDIEATPDAMVSLKLVLDFCHLNARREGIDDFGWEFARDFRYENLGSHFRCEARSAPNGLARLKRFLAHAAEEDTVARLGLRREEDTVRVVCDLVPPAREMMVYTEWIQVQVLLSIVRSATRPDWCPPEITFMSRFAPAPAALDAFGATRIRFGQAHTSFTVPLAILAAPLKPGRLATAAEPLPVAGAWTSDLPCGSFVQTMKQAMAVYVGAGEATLGTAAELAGMSRRTLQRALSECGYSFSGLLGEVRFERACELLADPDSKIIEVAIAAGYQNHAHFSRAFRRKTGISPSEYRRSGAAEAHERPAAR